MHTEVAQQAAVLEGEGWQDQLTLLQAHALQCNPASTYRQM